MSVSSGISPLAEYTGDDAAKSFAYPFRTFEDADVGVKVRLISTGVETTLVNTVDYTLDNVGKEGGNVDLVNAAQAWINAGDGSLKSTYEIYIFFDPANSLKQLKKFTDLGRNSPTIIEQAFDRLTMLVKGFFEGIGLATRTVRLPDNVHADEFDPKLPVGFNNTEEYIPAINDTKDGWKMIPIDGALYTPSSVQSIAAGGTITIVRERRQHVRIQSTGGVAALNGLPFGNNDALLRDGMEIVVEGVSNANVLTLAENDVDYGFIGNGGLEFRNVNIFTFIYNETQKRFKLKSSGAW